jgi:hypothetical protein
LEDHSQPTWKVSFLSGFLASSPPEEKPDAKQSGKMRRPLSSFAPFAAQRDVLRSAVAGEDKAVAVVPKSKAMEEPGTAAGREPWKRLIDKVRETAVRVSSAAADTVAGASPMTHIQG